MNILIVHCGKGIYGGAERVIVELSKYLENEDHRVRILAKDIPSAFIFDLLGTGAIVSWTESYRTLRSWTQKYMGWADVINVHNFPSTLTTFPSRLTTRTVTWMCNEPAELFTNWKRKPIEAFNRWWVKSSGMHVVVADKFNAERFEKIYGVKPIQVPYGVDYDFWSALPRIKRNDNILSLGQVGTITPYKNQMESIQVSEALLAEGIDTRLVLVGDCESEYAYQLMDYLHKKKLEKHVFFTGQLNQEQVRHHFRYDIDILLHPVKEQGGWLVPFEALCTGLPVITTTEFPAAEYLHKVGMPVTEPGLMLPVVKNIWNNYSNFADNERIKAWVRDNLTWEKFGKGMLDAYKENIRT